MPALALGRRRVAGARWGQAIVSAMT
jgi:hypothetical protein